MVHRKNSSKPERGLHFITSLIKSQFLRCSITLHALLSTIHWLFEANISVQRKRAIYHCLFKINQAEERIPLVVHCQNCGIFITEFAMSKKKKNKRRKKKHKSLKGIYFWMTQSMRWYCLIVKRTKIFNVHFRCQIL